MKISPMNKNIFFIFKNFYIYIIYFLYNFLFHFQIILFSAGFFSNLFLLNSNYSNIYRENRKIELLLIY